MGLSDKASPIGLILKRARSDWLVMTAALATVVMATTLLAAGPIYADAVTISTLRQTLDDAETQEANIEIAIGAVPAQIGVLDEAVVSTVGPNLERAGASLQRMISVGAFELPVQPSPDTTDIVEFRFMEDIAEQASLTAGRWPVPGDSNVEVSISESVAGLLGLEVGDDLRLINRRSRENHIETVVVGLYRPIDPSDPFWYDEELALTGIEPGSSFNVYGPLVVDETTVTQRLGGQRLELTWRVFPDTASFDVNDVGPLASDVATLESSLNRVLAETGVRSGSTYRVTTGLDAILNRVERSLTVTRSGVLMVTVQLAVLAGYALALTAGLLVDTRRTEFALLRARGAGNGQAFSMAVIEASALTIPAAFVAPWLASFGLNTLNSIGPLAAVDLDLAPRVTTAAYVIALLAAAGAILALALPAYRASRNFNDTFIDRGREGARGAAQRFGVDLALLILAGLAIWQLQAFGPQITAAGRRVIGVDPLLVLAPAIGLFAGAVLALRVVPMMARGAERLIADGRSAVAALSAWQLARRPLRYSRAGLLLMMAIAIGFFTATYADTWFRSQSDQAGYEAGGDLRVTPNRRTNDSLTDFHLEGAHMETDGVTASMPVSRLATELARSGPIGQFLLLDSTEAASVVSFRSDLASRELESMMKDLRQQRPELASLTLPGTPRRMALALDLRVAPLEWTPDFELRDREADLQHDFLPTARVTIQDGSGLLHRLDLGSVPTNRGPARLELSLVEQTGDTTYLPPTYPLSIVDLEIVALAPFHTLREGTFSLSKILVNDNLIGGEWITVTEAGAIDWDLAAVWSGNLFASPSLVQSSSAFDRALVADFTTGVSFGGFRTSATPVYFTMRPTGSRLPGTFAVIVSEGLLEDLAVSVGDSIRIPDLGDTRAEIVGAVKAFPTIDPDSGEVIVADLPTFQMLTHQPGSNPREVDEWWVNVEEGLQEAVARELAAHPVEAVSVVSRDRLRSSLTADPIALGSIGSLSVGFVAAAVFASVGFAVSLAVSARERVHEFAMLRALGLSPRQLFSWVASEHGALALLSVALGSTVGWLLGELTIPVIAITQDGTPAVPAVLISHPWNAIAMLELGFLAALMLFVVVLNASLRRLGLGSTLRIGED